MDVDRGEQLFPDRRGGAVPLDRLPEPLDVAWKSPPRRTRRDVRFEQEAHAVDLRDVLEGERLDDVAAACEYDDEAVVLKELQCLADGGLRDSGELRQLGFDNSLSWAQPTLED